MKLSTLMVAAFSAIVLSACSNVTPVQQLALPPVTIIEGTVSSMDTAGFKLEDSSGSIYVKTKMPNGSNLDVAPKEKIKVYGNLEGGQKPAFDAYVIEKENGEQTIITNPTPHFGLVLQSSF